MLNLHFWKNTNPMEAARVPATGKPLDLAHVRPGQQVIVSGFARLAPSHRQHLQAYGLLPGRQLTVLSQNPVTIVLVEQTELAFENEIARQIMVE